MRVGEQWEMGLGNGKERRFIPVYVHDDLTLEQAVKLRDELSRVIDNVRRSDRRKRSAQGIVTRRAETAQQAPGAKRVEPDPEGHAPVPSVGIKQDEGSAT